MNSNFGEPHKKFTFSIAINSHQSNDGKGGGSGGGNAAAATQRPAPAPLPVQPDHHFTQSDSTEARPCASTSSASVGGSGGGYGGGLIRISELQQRNVSIHSGLRVVPPNVPLPARARRNESVAEVAMAASSWVGGGTSALAPATVAYERNGRPQPSRPTRRGTRSGGATRGDTRGSTTLPLQLDGSLCEYRWYTKGGRRVLLYDGQSYKGTRAHKMWKSIVARGGGSTASSSSATTTTRPRRAAAPRQRKAKKAKKSTRTKGRRAASEAPTRAQLTRPTTLEISGGGELRTAVRPPAAPAVAVARSVAPPPPPLLMKGPPVPRAPSHRATAAVLLSQVAAGLPPSSQSVPARSQPSVVVEVTDSDEEREHQRRRQAPPHAAVKKEASAATVPSAAPTKWPMSYFPEDDGRVQWSSDDSTRDSRSGGSSGRPGSPVDEERGDSNGFRLEQFHGATVVEKDGWLYSQEAIEEMCSQVPARSAPPRSQHAARGMHEDEEDMPIWKRFQQDHHCVSPSAPVHDGGGGGGAWGGAPFHTRGDEVTSGQGIQVVGQVPPPPARAAAPVTRPHMNGGVVVAPAPPQLDRYEEGNAWDAMAPEEAEGFFENGDERGAVRYASL